MVVGITGSIASGKSLVTDYLIQKNYKVIDADVISREVTKKGGECYKTIVDTFGSEYLQENKEIDRKKLAKIIYFDKEKKKQLENIIHPVVLEKIEDYIFKENREIIFVSMPLLYEVGFEKKCDKVIVVYTNYDKQIERLMKRDNISLEYANDKIASQYPISLKISKSDYVIDNSQEKEKTYSAIEQVLKEIKENRDGI